MKICPRLLIFELSDCTLRIFRGYDFHIFSVLLFLDRSFGGFDSDLRGSSPVCLVRECPRGEALLGKEKYDRLNGWKTRTSVP